MKTYPIFDAAEAIFADSIQKYAENVFIPHKKPKRN
jgi:hypothetical protein